MTDFHVTSAGRLTGAGLSFSCAIGRGGIADQKSEGDGVTPAGDWTMIECFYRPDKMGPPKTGLPVRPIGRNQGWCDDPSHPSYNQLVQRPFAASHEVMWRDDGLYDALVVLDYNIDPVIPNKGSARFDYPIDYDIAVMGHDRERGRLDLIIRWAPGAYCHFHRHVASTTTLVLEGEHHVIDVDDEGHEGSTDVRPAGTYRISPGGDQHMEQGGPEGSLVLFSMYEPTGRMFDVLDADRNVIATATIDSLVKLSDQVAQPDPTGE